MVVGTSATWCCHEQCWGSHTFVALPNCLQWQSSSQPPWTWAKGVESRRIVRNETYQIYSKPWTSNGPITIHYLLNESCKPKCSWGISNSRLWPERPITQQLTIAMMGKLQSSEQVWDSLSRPVRSVYNRRPIKYSKEFKRLKGWKSHLTYPCPIVNPGICIACIGYRANCFWITLSWKMSGNRCSMINKNKKQTTSPRLSFCTPCSSSHWMTCWHALHDCLRE